MTNTYFRALARTMLILASLVVGVLNGSPLSAPILILAAYLLCVLVRQGRAAVNLYEAERLRRATSVRPADLRVENIPADWGMAR